MPARGGPGGPLAAALSWLAVAACAVPPPVAPGDVGFDTTALWIHGGPDSVRLVVEIAASEAQQELGLSGRPTLGADAGMLFVFEEERSVEDGFWMWRTEMPLDLAFLDGDGVVQQVLGMDVCADQATCPGYFPDAPYRFALETNRGWLARHGVGAGARVTGIR